MKKIQLVAFLGLLSGIAQAFIPSVPGILKEVFDNGHTGKPWEVVIRHRIEPRPGEVYLVEEKMLEEKGRLSFLWSGSVLGHATSGTLESSSEKSGYVLAGGHSIGTSSIVLPRYLAWSSADQMRDILLKEGFLRRDQFAEFEPNTTFEGDPQGWDLREKYIRHSDIYLHRLGSLTAIAVAGTEQANAKRIIYFDKGLRGIRRLEWVDGEAVAAWTLEGFSGKEGHPRHFTFEWNGNLVVTSDILFSRAAGDRQVQEFKAAARLASHDTSLSSGAESALKTLLSYR